MALLPNEVKKPKVVVCWFRRDLRLNDHRALSEALSSELPVLPLFIFDPAILSALEPNDRRVDYIHQALEQLNLELQTVGSRFFACCGSPVSVFSGLMQQFDIWAVYANRDNEPYALQRDAAVQQLLASQNISWFDFKDQAIFERNDVLKDDGKPYTVFSAYARKWRARLTATDYAPIKHPRGKFYETTPATIPALHTLGFQKTDIEFKKPQLRASVVSDYGTFRDFPSKDHTTRLGMALRFGTISVRKCVAFGILHNEAWLSQLIWREFFMQILYHFPHVVSRSFKPAYDGIEWRNSETEFDLWCRGETGYLLVDAGMRELNQTGFMHNRVRMVAASFLCKHLLIDWRWGEAYFASKLNDYDLSANNGNWQWVAGSGCDAAPYFRVFNPNTQLDKFDKNLEYVRKWIPQIDFYPHLPIVDHAFARQRALEAYSKAVNATRGF